jgi:hypothetical protein
MKGNIVGSSNTYFWDLYSPEDSYILGLWSADCYYWSSSIGITSVDEKLVKKFVKFLGNILPIERQRLRIYHPIDMELNTEDWKYLCEKVVKYPLRKCAQPNLQLYVNSRPLTRLMHRSRKNVSQLKDPTAIIAYFAGRFDGDGSISKDLRSDCRIVYGTKAETEVDQRLLKIIGIDKSSIYHYKQAREYCLYISKLQSEKFVSQIRLYSETIPKIRVRTL